MRINKFIARAGIASRRNAEKYILEGRVKVNNRVITNLSTRVNIETDIVKVDDKEIYIENKKYYIMLNKPVGYTCTNSSQFNEKLIFDLINIKVKLFSIGRLDKDSRGLILITNDGDIYNKVIHPRNEVFKEYIVKVDKFLIKEHKIKLENGIDIGNYITNPAIVNYISDNILSIKINEGKNRQIRKMLAVLGYKVLDLNRISIGEIKLENLDIGKYRDLTSKEIEYLNNL